MTDFFKGCIVRREKWEVKKATSTEEYWSREYVIIAKVDRVYMFTFDIKEVETNIISRIRVDLTTYYEFNVNDRVFTDYRFDIVPILVEDIVVKNIEPVIDNTKVDKEFVAKDREMQTNNSIKTSLINEINTTQKMIDANIEERGNVWSMFIGFSAIIAISLIIGIFVYISEGASIGPIACFSITILFKLLLLIPIIRIICLTKDNKKLNNSLDACRTQLEELK